MIGMTMLLGVAAAPAAAAAGPATPPQSPSATTPLTATQSTCVSNLNKELNTRERIGQLIWMGMYADNPRAADSYVTT